MLNGYPLNAAPINAPSAGELPDPPTIPVYPPKTLQRWQVQVRLGDQDVTDSLTGQVRVDREEAAAGIAEFDLWINPADPVPLDVHDLPVQITFSDTEGEAVLFTGFAAEPHWNPVTRILRITCSDLLQQRVEAMSVAAIGALTEGLYSPDIFGPIESRWQYAQDRLSTRPAALDCSPTGTLRVTDWAARPAPRYSFGYGSTIYQSATVDLAQKNQITNQVELTLSYRYPRFQQAVDQFSWQHPAQNFCTFRTLTTELPDIAMVLDAAAGTGAVITQAAWQRLPPSGVQYCNGQPVAWTNNYPDLLLGFDVKATRRWVQSVTETHNITLRLGGAQEIVRRESYSAQHQSDSEELYKDITPVDQAGGTAQQAVSPGDQLDSDQRNSFFLTALHQAKATLLQAHRQTRISWQRPCSSVMKADLAHTLRMADQGITATGKCVRREDVLDIESGSAITSLTIAVSRGGGADSTLAVPPRIGAGQPTDRTASSYLPTQLGGRFTSPAQYNEELNGFSGMYDAIQDTTLPVFPRRLAMATSEFAQDITNALELSTGLSLQVAAPIDELEL